METWSVRDDDRPRLRPEEAKSASWPWFAGAAAVLAVMAAAYYYFLLDARLAPPPPAEPAPASSPAPVVAPPEPEVRHPLATPAEPPALPALANSDAFAREALADLIGGKAFNEHVIPVELVRRIVATVDNLPRQSAPRRAIPLQPVPGAFVTDGGNDSRYGPYIRVFEAIDSRALAERYARAYPLFQRAYEELGFPGKYFNDRVMEAIDDLLAAPEPAQRPELVQSKVLWEFADPDLEKRSAGQKILLRMGTANAQRVKAKLREIRRELAALRKP
jgi:hypothetical protein